ncbi:MAG: Uma2 family endonuclease [Chloroflexaceae bacterium]|nr:Uma2 family endonuclease [Chloroflexaceae bacterium]
MDTILEQLRHAPQLRLYYEAIGELLAAEAACREHFYATVREDEKAEFINGEVIVQSPVKLEHNEAGLNLISLLRTYVVRHNLGIVGYEKLLIALTRNDYEPDVCFFSAAKAAHLQPDQIRFPDPDFIAEVLTPSTATTDRGIKFTDYAAHGVAEYWLIDPATHTVEQYELRDAHYHLLTKARSDTITSVAVAGFSIPIAAIFERSAHLATLQHLLTDTAA